MTADYSVRETVSGAYRITEPTIREVVRHVGNMTRDKVSITFEFRPSMSLRDSNLDNLLADPLKRTKNINEISVSSSNYKDNLSRSASVRLRRATILSNVEISASGERSEVTMLVQNIRNELSAVRYWYDPIVLSNRVPWNFVSLGIFTVVTQLYLVSYSGMKLEPDAASILGFLVGSFFFAAGYLKNKIMPALNFEFGRGKSDAEKLSFIRNFILIIVVMGLAIGVAGNYVSSILLSK